MFIQQNWQQQIPLFSAEPSTNNTTFFDNIPCSSQAVHQNVSNNNVEPSVVDGWGNWDDWNQSENLFQNKSKPIQNIALETVQENIWKRDDTASTLTPPHPFLSTVPSSAFLSNSMPSIQSNDNSLESFTRSGQFQVNNEQPSSVELRQSPTILIPSSMININEHKEPDIGENLGMFRKIEASHESLSSSKVNDPSIVTQVFPRIRNYEEDSICNVQQNLPENQLHEIAINAIQSTSVLHNNRSIGTTKPTSISVSDTFDNQKSFLIQGDCSNGRDRFLSQCEKLDNLLPPPLAYQQQTTANDDRNQYLQTSHLSEDDFVVLNNPSNDDDVNLPPPGLSRFVLGEPEHTANLERHADGEDNDSIQPAPASISSETNRSVYSFQPPIELQVQRVVTGVESITISPLPLASISQVESREIHLDGENIEDQQAPKPREGLSIGGDICSKDSDLNNQKSSSIPKVKTLSNSSTGNESDHYRNNSKKYSSKSGKPRKRFESDDSEGSSHPDRLRSKEKDKKRRNPLKDSDDGGFSKHKGLKHREENTGSR